MLSVEQAAALILQHAAAWPDEIVSLASAWNRILAEPLLADRDFPPFTRVSMDGIAIDYSAFAAGRRQFPILGVQAAGMPPLRLDDPNGCIEVMTGAMLPGNTDTVIRYEDLDISENAARVAIEDIRQGQNAHLRGTDRLQGDLISPAGVRITGAELGIAATVGKTSLKVKGHPRIALVASGDELVAVETQPLPHQIRTSNIFALQGLLQSWGLGAGLLHLSDARDEIVQKLRLALDDYDVLILSGGVSAGKFDYLPEAFEELGVRKIFHKVQQRPGKPFWFGVAPGKTVFALPGNPVSSFMCTIRYIQPWLRASMGMQPLPPRYAALAEDFSFKPSLTYFLQVKIESTPDGRLIALPAPGKGSGDHANLSDADGFLELPAERQLFHADEAFPLWGFRR
jgi:molybdopterin molybdotransferase